MPGARKLWCQARPVAMPAVTSTIYYYYAPGMRGLRDKTRNNGSDFEIVFPGAGWNPLGGNLSWLTCLRATGSMINPRMPLCEGEVPKRADE
jgi:hypothetical protein